MKRILVVGNGEHYFNKKLYTKLKSQGILVDFFSDTSLSFDENNPYKEVFTASIKEKKIPWFFNFKGGKGFFIDKYLKKELKKLIKTKQYDIIHIQGAKLWALRAIKSFPFSKILSVWGSDIYRVNRIKLTWLKKGIRRIDVLTFSSSDTKFFFTENFFFHPRIELIRFGLDLLEVIKQQAPLFKKTNKKTIITIGYNRDKEQQHIKILNAFKLLPKNLIEDIEIILPFTYGHIDIVYKNNITHILEKLGVTYSFLDHFLSEEELAKKRLETDIMIQLQVTDQFSGSMQEHLFAKNIVITGSWLKYSDLVNEGCYYETVNDTKDLAEKLSYIIANLQKHKALCENNPHIIKKLSSWENNINDWKKLYN